ncbi:MAG: PD40 domain-containing protein [Bryobacterales bacterium]|nr:PD40 domain-containing protein [Bryobacterales bacterium]
MKEPQPQEVRAALERLLASVEMSQSARMGQFLKFVVEEELAGQGSRLKETVVGVHVFGREPGYDPKADPVVRVEARRLRFKIQEYYQGSGQQEALRIELPKGTYQPRFTWAEETPAPAAPLPVPVVAPSPGRQGMGLAAAVVLCLASAAFIAARTDRPVDEPLTPQLLLGHENVARAPAYAPNGTRIAYTLDRNFQHSEIRIQALPKGESRPLHGEIALDYEPAWSPNGSQIAFLRAIEQGRMAVMLCQVDACQPRKIAEVALRGPIDWTPSGGEVLAADRDDAASPHAIVAIPIEGPKRRLTSPPTGTYGDLAPRLSPDGQRLAFVRAVSLSAQDIYLAGADGSNARAITARKLPVEGMTWTADSRYLIASLVNANVRSLFRIPSSGEGMKRIADAGLGAAYPSAPRRAHGLAYQVRFADTNIWSIDLASGERRVLSQTPQLDTGPQIAPNGRHVVWRSTASGTNEVWMARADGREGRQLTFMKGPVTGSGRWSPDGASIVYESHPNGNGDLFLIPAAGGAARTITRENWNEILPSFSQDGRWIYYSTDRSGSWEVWRIQANGSGAQPVVRGGAFAARESPDGAWLYYTKRIGSGGGGIYRMPSGGGAEQQMTAELTPNFWGQWAVSENACTGWYSRPRARGPSGAWI